MGKWNRRCKPYPKDKEGPEDEELIWPDHPPKDEPDEEDVPPDVDVLELMNRNLEPEPPRQRGGYRAHVWRDEWIER